MAENSAIEWTDHTWTVIAGCDAVSPACANCYAATMAARLEAMGQEKYRGLATREGGKGKWTGKVVFWEPDLVKPLQVQKPGRWFLTSMGDIAHDALTMEQIADVFGVMAVAGAAGKFHGDRDGFTPNGSYTPYSGADPVTIQWPNYLSGPHTFMVLTKRPQRMAQLLHDWRFRKLVAQAAYKWAHNRIDAGYLSGGIYPFGSGDNPERFWPFANVFIGATVEDQQRCDERGPAMASIAAAGWKTFVSYEPALGPVNWTGWEFLKQLISGGESGPKARPSDPDWHRGARDFAAAHGIPFMFKQWGAWLGPHQDGAFDHEPLILNASDVPIRVGKKAAGRRLDGRTHDEFPG